MSLSHAPAEKLFIFVHIPKTGGTTLWHIINQQYETGEFWSYNHQPDYRQMIENAHKMKCLIGHFPFGVHQHIKRPCTYFTMLRNPVERVISFYYYYRARAAPKLVEHLSFADFLESPLFYHEISNTQTLYLAGGESPDLQKAKENLSSHVAVPGIMEMFNESLFFIKNECGWNINHYQSVNMATNRPAEMPFSPDLLDIVKRKNELDLELHEFARHLLETKIQQLAGDKKAEFIEFIKRAASS